jgi:hypothetical protein
MLVYIHLYMHIGIHIHIYTYIHIYIIIYIYIDDGVMTHITYACVLLNIRMPLL